MRYKIHFPLTLVEEVYKTKMDVFQGSLENCGTVVKEGFTGFTLMKLRDSDYAFIAESWETNMIKAYQQLQNEQFRQEYGEEY